MRHGIRRPAAGPTAAIALDLASRTIIIGGTRYAGEIKKSIFTVLNYLLPNAGVLSMHCSANMGPAGDVALFFGLSGTGKTTLSADPRAADRRRRARLERRRRLQLRGRLLRQGDPPVGRKPSRRFHATPTFRHRPGERGAWMPRPASSISTTTRLTENTRAAYPSTSSPTTCPRGRGGHPSNIILLTADAFGVLPPIARLTPEQAMYHFLSGYTAKLAGTERGPERAAGHVQHLLRRARSWRMRPAVYAELLGEKIQQHGSAVLAGEHRLERRPLRRRPAHEDRPHPRHDHRHPGRQSADGADRARPDLWRGGAGECPGVPAEGADSRATPGPTRRPTMPGPATWPGALPRTSSSSVAWCRRRWPAAGPQA